MKLLEISFQSDGEMLTSTSRPKNVQSLFGRTISGFLSTLQRLEKRDISFAPLHFFPLRERQESRISGSDDPSFLKFASLEPLNRGDSNRGLEGLH